jgi:aminodeoxyfutalosine synthase
MDVIKRVKDKIDAGIRLSDQDALDLFESPDLLGVGRLADQVNRAKNNDVVFYNVNRHINPTNICALSCKFCAYSRKPGDEGAYAYSIDEMVKKAGEAVEQGATEVHMVGGLHPRWKYDYYKDMIAAVKTAYPALHIKAFTAVELDWLARKARKTIPQILEELNAVGLGSMPGGGAEIFHPEIRDVICDTKVSGEEWINTHRIAHNLGMHSNCTMLYGHIENYSHRVDHMRRLRELQDETKGFNAFIPLSFQPFQNEMGINQYTFGYDDLKTIAVARLYLDNFKHIKAYWIMLGQDIAQLALHFGANDLDGTVVEEKISRQAGGRAGMQLSKSAIEAMVHKARRFPCERDTLYNRIGTPKFKDFVTTSEKINDESFGQILNRTTYDQLSSADLIALALNADLYTLHKLADAVAGERESYGDMRVTPATIININTLESIGQAVTAVHDSIQLNIAAHKIVPSMVQIELSNTIQDQALPEFDFLVELVWALKNSFPDKDVAISGMKTLWKMAQSSETDVKSLLKQLKAAGLDQIHSSDLESETDITHAEISGLHTQALATGVSTIGKAELSAPAQGAGEPLWDGFVQRLFALREVSFGVARVSAVKITTSPGSFVTPVEYMKAISIARIILRPDTHVIAPARAVPVMSSVQGIGASDKHHPAEKIAALTSHFGASSLGPVDLSTFDIIAAIKQIRSTGFQATLDSASVAQPAAVENIGSFTSEIRHIPHSIEVQL